MEREKIQEALRHCVGSIELPELGTGYHGKVRDCFTVGKHRILVASDRISAFDRVFAEGIPFKGQVLNQLSVFFLKQAASIVDTHFLESPDPSVTLAREASAYPVEVVVRGWLTGSAWRDYEQGRFEANYGFALPAGLRQHSRLPGPVITPTTKATEGHDKPIPHAEAARLVGGQEAWDAITRAALGLFRQGTELADRRGLTLVDTKYEFGQVDGRLTLIDEIHTPDSSRYWLTSTVGQEGREPEQLSKEFLRDWLRARGFTGEGPVPALPDEIRVQVAERYLALYRTLTGEDLVPSVEEDPGIRIQRNLRRAGHLRAGVVSILMGSDSDRPLAEKVRDALTPFDIPCLIEVASAHKVPEKVMRIVERMNRSAQPVVHVTIAGRSNGLSGVTAGSSIHPVIALPPFKDASDYMVNVHSSLQMPSETPVLTVLDPGNAALAAARILAGSDEDLRRRVRSQIQTMKARFGVEVS